MIKITPNIFIAVKTLLESGETNANIAKYLKISEKSVSQIKGSENYDEYRAILAAIVAKNNERRKAEKAAKAAEAAKTVGAVPASTMVPPAPPVQVVEHRQSIQVNATHYMETKLDIMIELLKGISAKLAAIIDDLYGTGKKEGA